MSRHPPTDAQLWKIAAEASFEVVTHALQKMNAASTAAACDVLRESQAATCALQELHNRALGLEPKSLSE